METLLPAIWFFLWGLLWAIYFALDGFDLGSGVLTPFFKTDEERESLISSLGPIWDGNEVWIITAGGVTFAAFPKVYATLFSSFYLPLMLVLLGLVLRAVAIEFFHLNHNPRWQRFWVNILSGASLVVALLLGVAFGNIFQGLPLDADGYHGTLVGLLNPYGLITGVLFVLAFLFNGAAWIAHKTDDAGLRAKGLAIAQKLWIWLIVVAAAFLVYTPFATSLLDNFLAYPVLFVMPLLAVVLLVMARSMVNQGRATAGLVYGSLTVLVLVMATIAGLFPNMFPSAIDPAYSLTAFNASSSIYTLKIMLIVTVIFLPLVLVYQVYFYKLFAQPGSGKESGY